MRNACDSDSRCGLACDASARDAKSLAMWVERCEPLSFQMVRFSGLLRSGAATYRLTAARCRVPDHLATEVSWEVGHPSAQPNEMARFMQSMEMPEAMKGCSPSYPYRSGRKKAHKHPAKTKRGRREGDG